MILTGVLLGGLAGGCRSCGRRRGSRGLGGGGACAGLEGGGDLVDGDADLGVRADVAAGGGVLGQLVVGGEEDCLGFAEALVGGRPGGRRRLGGGFAGGGL